jgi:glyoxylase I family protein
MPSLERALHAGLTVRDMDTSAEWYTRVLGFELVKRFTPSASEPGVDRVLILHPAGGFLLGLYNHPGRSGDRFDPLRTGLDHLAFEVTDQTELHRWLDKLDDLNVEHSPVRDLGHSRFVSLEDPDGIQLELWLTLQPHRPAR